MKKTTLKLMLAIIAAFLLVNVKISSQENQKPAGDTLAPIVKGLLTDVKPYKNLKITGFAQSQWQMAQSPGTESYTGGDFTSTDKRYGLDNRFTLIKGRVRINYSNELSQYVLLFNATERGMAIKDFYASFTDPWTKSFTVTGGVFCRPIGIEVEYSSAELEPAERSRITQTLFPNEEDVGAKLTIQAPSTNPLNFLKLDLAMICGNGINLETDKYKDFIGRLIATKKFMNDQLTLRVGAACYIGGWALPQNVSDLSFTKLPIVYKMNNKGFVADTSYKAGAQLKRQYIDIDAQIILKSSLGTTTLRGEYITGTQPGTKSSSVGPTGLQADVQTYTTKKVDSLTYSTTADKALYLNPYIRKFTGGYVTFIQNILGSKHDLVVRYDWYDPNTDVKKDEIGNGATWDATAKKIIGNTTKTGYPDVGFSTLGIGWIYHWNTYVKLLAYYEIVTNETTNSVGFIEDAQNTGMYDAKSLDKVRKDNVFTFRMQFRF
jgi:hypothetical protein